MATIAAAALAGDRRVTLAAMRDKLARDMDEAPPAVVAQIAGRLQAILQELDEMGDPKAVSTLDDLERKRADRLAAANVPAPPRRPARQRRA